jgi:hypothetical protein
MSEHSVARVDAVITSRTSERCRMLSSSRESPSGSPAWLQGTARGSGCAPKGERAAGDVMGQFKSRIKS